MRSEDEMPLINLQRVLALALFFLCWAGNMLLVSAARELAHERQQDVHHEEGYIRNKMAAFWHVAPAMTLYVALNPLFLLQEHSGPLESVDGFWWLVSPAFTPLIVVLLVSFLWGVFKNRQGTAP